MTMRLKLGETHHMPLTHCPSCGHLLTAATNTTGAGEPQPGDLTVCIECASLLQFGPKLALSVLGKRALARLDEQSRADLLATQDLIRQARATGRA